MTPYFISIETVPGAAKRAVALAVGAGVSLTVAGSTWPGGVDLQDCNIRIAPSFAKLDEVTVAAEVIALSILPTIAVSLVSFRREVRTPIGTISH